MYVMRSGSTPLSFMSCSRPSAVSSSPGVSLLLAGASQAFKARLYVTVSGCTPGANARGAWGVCATMNTPWLACFVRKSAAEASRYQLQRHCVAKHYTKGVQHMLKISICIHEIIPQPLHSQCKA